MSSDRKTSEFILAHKPFIFMSFSVYLYFIVSIYQLEPCSFIILHTHASVSCSFRFCFSFSFVCPVGATGFHFNFERSAVVTLCRSEKHKFIQIITIRKGEIIIENIACWLRQPSKSLLHWIVFGQSRYSNGKMDGELRDVDYIHT